MKKLVYLALLGGVFAAIDIDAAKTPAPPPAKALEPKAQAPVATKKVTRKKRSKKISPAQTQKNLVNLSDSLVSLNAAK